MGDIYRKASVQYRSALFYLTKEQEATARYIVMRLDEEGTNEGRQVFVDIQPPGRFYQAEKHHQNYLAKRGQK